MSGALFILSQDPFLVGSHLIPSPTTPSNQLGPKLAFSTALFGHLPQAVASAIQHPLIFGVCLCTEDRPHLCSSLEGPG